MAKKDITMSWEKFIKQQKKEDVPDDFLSPKDRNQGSHDRDPFEDLDSPEGDRHEED
ncbi:MAG: hypothetical protein KBT87_08675 [Gammaproteobacteria bacterium]|nr:hypothetical protein [Gammaproteobacteria bacterium]MBQ0774731.1 hypothetical protein [Gammaproteobacteria bacterium]